MHKIDVVYTANPWWMSKNARVCLQKCFPASSKCARREDGLLARVAEDLPAMWSAISKLTALMEKIKTKQVWQLSPLMWRWETKMQEGRWGGRGRDTLGWNGTFKGLYAWCLSECMCIFQNFKASSCLLDNEILPHVRRLLIQMIHKSVNRLKPWLSPPK